MTDRSVAGVKAKRPRGRPKEYDYTVVMKELDEWSKLDDSINIVGFCASHGYLADVIRRMIRDYEDFENTYLLAKMRLADRREKLLNSEKLNYGSWNRYQKMFDPFLDKFEEKEKDRDMKRKMASLKQDDIVNLATMAKLFADGKICQSE